MKVQRFELEPNRWSRDKGLYDIAAMCSSDENKKLSPPNARRQKAWRFRVTVAGC